ncbi:MAG: sensor histidine kinase, partial [Gammaproteobacteria bacterium]
AVLLGANLALLLTLLWVWPPAAALRSFVAYLGFQGFAWLLATYARRAEQARDDAQRLNAELLATRELLAEGARAGERLHLSRELHDVAGQKLTALKMQLALLEQRAPQDLAAPIQTLRALADELLAELRAVVGALRRSDGIDLHAALTALARAFPQPQVVLDLASDARAPDLGRAEALLRAAQEALTNAARHSGAQRVELRLTAGDGQLVLEVRDDGRGLRGAPAGYGLTGMRERLDSVGGTLTLADLPGGGLRLCASVPMGLVE